MIPWSQLGAAKIPGGEGELRLMQRGGEFSIMLGSIELMNSRRGGSEEALVTLSCAKLRNRASPHILIGGLGMGFTLRAALAALGADARVDVAELVPEVVTWAHTHLAVVMAGSLADPRVHVWEEDVGHLIQSRPDAYDAILLDVDNGPEGLTRAANDSLYGITGLNAAKAALRTDGVLAVWSSGPNAAFTQRLRKTGFRVDEVPVRANAGRGAQHVIWIATRPVA